MVYRLFKDGKYLMTFHEEEAKIDNNTVSICNVTYVIRSVNKGDTPGVTDLVSI